MQSSITYPQFRKYKNNKSFFKLCSNSEFEEIQVLGNTYSLHFFKATILPDRNLIYDLTFDYHNYCDVISGDEYEEIKQKVIF